MRCGTFLGENSLRAIGIRSLVLVVARAAAMILAGPSNAQEKPDDTGFIGVPEYSSTETGILFFHEQLAHGVDRWFDEIRKAIKSCDRTSYDKQGRFNEKGDGVL